MINYIDENGNVYSFEENITKEFLTAFQENRGITLTKIEDTQVKSLQLFGTIDKTTDEIKAEELKLEKQEKLDNTHNSLQKLCDEKTRDAKKYIAGFEMTQEQLERYEEKYEMALDYKTDKSYSKELQLEATLNNTTVDVLADVIIKKGEAYKQALKSFNAMIEAFRTKVKELIAVDINKAISIIEKAKNLNASTTITDIEELLK